MWRSLLTPVVLVSALGYFVDIYDLVVFAIVRVIPLTLALKALQPTLGLRLGGARLFAGTVAVAFVALRGLRDTYGRDLDFVER